MKFFRFKLLIATLAFALSFDCALGAKEAVTQPPELRQLCKKAQESEKKIKKSRSEIDRIEQEEKASVPIVRDIYEILTRCFTILFNMQRFSNLLVLSNAEGDKNDFVKCSIVIKNFASYFKSISAQLEKIGAGISKLKKIKREKLEELKSELTEYESVLKGIESTATELARNRVENVIQNDVIYHLATKSESLEELDAELEAENEIGVLKNKKISSELAVAYPVAGKIVDQFGDKGPNNDMICYVSFETCPDAIVTSPAKGLVVFSGKFLNYGNLLIISNGEYRIFLYGMDVLFSAAGDAVEIGDYVGRMKEKTSENPVIKMELKKSGEPLDPCRWMLETMDKKEKK